MTTPIQRILIADDEPLARQRIRRLLDAVPGYQVCGEATDGDDALRKVAELEPDILLLDIRMPGLDGMDTADRLSRLDKPPAVIFCTAYDHYAIQAFNVNAVAYLLKPVRKEALASALAR
ncbi:MAG TPA: response regulator, partial [Marinobacter sp.]|nr:response regulator [Marinobacter sp.]